MDRLIASPEAQSVLLRDENDLLTKRRALIDQLKELPEKYAKLKLDAEKPVILAADRLRAAENELLEARANLHLAQAVAGTPSRSESTELFNIERQLLETADTRLLEFKIHVDNLRQAVGHSIVTWPTTTTNYITKDTFITILTNADDVSATMTALSECANDCQQMRFEAVSFTEITNRLSVWSETLREQLTEFGLPCPRIDADGAVVLDGKRVSGTQLVERAIQSAKGTGKKAISA